MKSRRASIIFAISVTSLIAGFIIGPWLIATITKPMIVAEANWVDQSFTVSEQSSAADLIVRVRVLDTTTRELRAILPQYSDGVTIDGEKEFITLFTDSNMQVLEVYKGKADEFITVMQTGASVDETTGDSGKNFAINGDPIFTKESEHILFLVDITNDGVHSTGRKLYRIVNPYGRYEILDGKILAPVTDELSGSDAERLPQTLNDLTTQISLATTDNK